MGTTIIGDPRRFAIEYEVEDTWTFGRVTLWLDGLWLGDLNRSSSMYHMARSLQAMSRRDYTVMRCMYSCRAEVPDDETMFKEVGWSWGDSFDDFHFFLFAVEEERCVHFLWELDSSRRSLFPEYPPGPHHVHIPYVIFDEIVTRFSRAIGIAEQEQ